MGVTISERYPEMIKKNSQSLNNILELIFTHMIDIESEILPEWANPPDGFNEENEEEDDQKIIKFCMNCIDRLIAHVGNKVMLPHLSDCVAKMLNSDDWKMKNAALMALSQVGEYMENLKDIEPILSTINNHINHENPRIRYACLHGLGQISDDMCPEPEVVKIMDQLYERLIFNLENGSSFVKENALAALSALSEGAGINFIKFYDQTMEFMIQVLKNYTKKEYKQIRGQSIECITIMSATMGKEHFAKFQDTIIGEMLKVQNNDINSETEDPQKNYLLSGWQRILIIIGDDFVKYVDDIFPSLLDIVKKIISEETPKAVVEEEEGKLEGNTYQDDEAEIAIEMLGVFLNQLGEKLCNWFQEIWVAIEPILSTWNAQVKKSACKILPLLVKLLKKSDLSANVPNFSRQLIARLWKGMDDESDSEVSKQLPETHKDAEEEDEPEID